ncbi:MAG TPA: hypothetical protein VFN52_02170 [Acidiferrobacteraceae bacterium]|nr:hypothetical protein [Acidiferrobacteraceae bacterium]
MGDELPDSDLVELRACALLVQAGTSPLQASPAERILAKRLAEALWQQEQAEARLRAYADAAQCFGPD